MDMQKNEPNVLSTQTSTVHAILQNQIIDESLNEPAKVDYSALHNGRDLNIKLVVKIIVIWTEYESYLFLVQIIFNEDFHLP